MEHLQIVFEHLSAAGLTLRGREYHIGLPRVSYLGHVFSCKRMEPDMPKLLHPGQSQPNYQGLGSSWLGIILSALHSQVFRYCRTSHIRSPGFQILQNLVRLDPTMHQIIHYAENKTWCCTRFNIPKILTECSTVCSPYRCQSNRTRNNL